METHEPGNQIEAPHSRFQPLNFDNGADWSTDLLVRIDYLTDTDIQTLRNFLGERQRQRFDSLPEDKQLLIATMATLTAKEWEIIRIDYPHHGTGPIIR